MNGCPTNLDGLVPGFDAVTDDQERSRWAQQHLGRSWMDFTPALSAVGDAICTMGADVREVMCWRLCDKLMAGQGGVL